jgi:hypothetical protein
MMNKTAMHPFLLHQRKNDRLFTLLVFSLLAYGICDFWHSVFNQDVYRAPQTLALLLMIYAAFRQRRVRIEDHYFRRLFTLFILWTLFTIARFDKLGTDEYRAILYQPRHLFGYLLPLAVVFLPLRRVLFKRLFTVLVVTGFVFLFTYYVADVLLYPESNLLDAISTAFISGVLFLYLTWKSHSKKVRVFALAVILVEVLAGVLAGRRNVLISCGTTLFFGWCLIVFYNEKKKAVTKVVYILGTALAGIVLISNINFQSSAFSTLNDRISTDSRSDVFLAFVGDMTGTDWVIGKGIDGTYYDPIKYWDFTNSNSEDIERRDNIENGFLFLILKGGLVYLLLFLMIILPAIYRGLFRSSNLLAKAAALFLVVYLLDMASFGQLLLNMKYFLAWLSISVCYSKTIREISQGSMQKLLRITLPTD